MKKTLLIGLCSAVAMMGSSMKLQAAPEAVGRTTQSWALLQGPDGMTWSVSNSVTWENVGNEYYNDYRYQKLEVTVCDGNHQQMGVFTIDVEGTHANQLDVFGPITQHLFDSDDDYEVGVNIHIPGNAENGYKGKSVFRAYKMTGEMLMEAEGNAVIVENGDDSRLLLYYQEDGGLMGMGVYDIYKPSVSGSGVELAHQFKLDNMVQEYMCAPAITPAVLSDGLHFVLAYYEKPRVQLNEYGEPQYDWTTGTPIWEPDNYLIVENYNSNFELVDEFVVSTECPEGIMVRMMGIGAFSDKDVTEGYFTGDDRYNYVVLCEDTNENWNDEYNIDVYSQGGDFVGNFCSKVGGFWNRLNSIEGEPDQWAFVHSTDEGEQQVVIVEAPGLRVAMVVPSIVDGKLISSNLDRMPDAVEGYKYVVGLNEPSIDGDANVFSHYGIYHKDFTIDHYVSFNMGPNAETFTPLVNYQSLDRHLFCADEKMEFIFLSKVKGADNQLYNTLFVGDEDGNVIRTWTGDGTTKGDILNVSILNYGTSNPELFVSYYDWDSENYQNEYIPLPLSELGIEKVHNSLRDDVTYNLQGQRVSPESMGLQVRQKILLFKQ